MTLTAFLTGFVLAMAFHIFRANYIFKYGFSVGFDAGVLSSPKFIEELTAAVKKKEAACQDTTNL